MQPWVWVTHDHRQLGQGDHRSPFTVLGDKYAQAIAIGAQAVPFTLPCASASEIDSLLNHCDGVLFTGSPSNVHPSHFQQDVLRPELPLDPQRDALSLPLIRACIAQGVPMLGICRGFQEINVALGGSLHQQVQEVAGMQDHREPAEASYADQYAPRHPIRILPNTVLAEWAGGDTAMVNSLHGQGIDRLADDLLPMAPMVWWKRFKCALPLRLRMPFSGTPNGAAKTTLFTCASFKPLAKPASSGWRSAWP